MIDLISNHIAPIYSADGIQAKGAGGFQEVLMNQLKEIDQGIVRADEGVRKLAIGEDDNLHRIMLDISKARTSFELAVQVRNRVVEGIQELLRMSV